MILKRYGYVWRFEDESGVVLELPLSECDEVRRNLRKFGAQCTAFYLWKRMGEPVPREIPDGENCKSYWIQGLTFKPNTCATDDILCDIVNTIDSASFGTEFAKHDQRI